MTTDSLADHTDLAAPPLAGILAQAREEMRQQVRAACQRTARNAAVLVDLGRAHAGGLLESGRALDAGLRTLRTDALARGSEALAGMAEDLAECSALGGPQELLRLQERLVRRNAGQALGQWLAVGRAWTQLAADLSNPLSAGVTRNLEAIRALA